MGTPKRMPVDLSYTLSVYKAFAILLVVCAHCVYGNAMLNKITSLLGSIGVPIFLLCAGFLLNAQEDNKRFWSKKLKRIVVPWILYGVVTYFVHILKHAGGSISGLALWCIGHGTWLYFPTILLIYYLLFRFFKNNAFSWMMIAVFFVSNLLEILKLNVITDWLGTPYLNIFNRIGWFATGVLISRKGWITGLVKKRKVAILTGIGAVILGALCINVQAGLLTEYCQIPFLLCSVYTLFGLSSLIKDNGFLRQIGSETYIIYFLHMQFGMLVANVIINLARLETLLPFLALILKPTINLVSVFIGACLLKRIMARIGLKRLNWIFGLSK